MQPNNEFQTPVSAEAALIAIAQAIKDAFGTNARATAYIEKTAAFTTTSGTAVQVTGLTLTITVPQGGGRYKFTAGAPGLYNTTNDTRCELSIWDGVVASGTQLTFAWGGDNESFDANSAIAQVVKTLSEGSHTINVGLLAANAGTANLWGSSTGPSFLLIEPC